MGAVPTLDRASTLGKEDRQYIQSVKELNAAEHRRGTRKLQRRRVGVFGVANYLMYFVVTEYRKPVKNPVTPVPMSGWAKYQFETMFRGWN